MILAGNFLCISFIAAREMVALFFVFRLTPSMPVSCSNSQSNSSGLPVTMVWPFSLMRPLAL